MATKEIVGQHADGDYLQAAEVENYVRASGGFGVLTHSITATIEENDMDVTLPAFNYVAPDGSGGYEYVEYAGAALTVTTADADDPRNDLIIGRSNGTVEILAGTPTEETGDVEDAPLQDLPSDAIAFAKVRVDAAVTVIEAADVSPRAVDVSDQVSIADGPVIPLADFAGSAGTTQAFSTNTTARVTRVVMPQGKFVSQVSLEATAVGTAGTLAFAVFSEDGQTRHINDVTASISGAGLETVDVTDTWLPAGIYYLMVVSQSTANVTVRAYTAAASIAVGAPSDEDEISGTVTVTASTIPATFDPDTDVTYADVGSAMLRFD